MKDCSKKFLEDSRPSLEPKEAIEFVLSQLYEDKKHYIADEIAPGCTYEELIGALLLARDACDELKEMRDAEDQDHED